MQQAVATQLNAPARPWQSWLGRALVFISGISLLSVFYFGGAFSHLFPQPSGSDKAAGAPLFKTTQTTSVSTVVTKALAFKALLTTAQQATLEQTYTTTLARKWSNLPCGAGCRNGIEFGNLNAQQLAAALAVIQEALGTGTNNGYDEFVQIRLAEAYLNANGGGSGYDTTLRWICFLNDPSTTGAWMLQFGGHHYAANIAFNNGHVIGATPFFMGLEPTSFTWNATTYAPLTDEHDALANMLASLTSAELTTAKLSQTFSDCVMIPGETNGGTGTFPTRVGVACSTLTTAQKDLVIAAIGNYVNDMDATTAAAVMAQYTNQIDSTFISYTGSGTSGSASSFLNTNSNYVRIDGPGVWIELTCQNGIVFPSQIHYHTVWRDHNHDYGLDLTGDPIDTTTTSAVAQVAQKNTLSIFPNPATSQVSLSLGTSVSDATIVLVSATGRSTTLATHYNGSVFQYNVLSLPAGLYILRVQDGNTLFTGKFNKL
jgi:hypothetical protein